MRNSLTYQTTSSQARKSRLQRLMAGDVSHFFSNADEASQIRIEIETVKEKMAELKDKLIKLEQKLQIVNKSSEQLDKTENTDYPIKPFINRDSREDINLLKKEKNSNFPPDFEKETNKPQTEQPTRAVKKGVIAKLAQAAVEIADAVDFKVVKARIYANPALKKALSWGVYEGLLYKVARKIGVKALGEIAFNICKLADDYFRLTDKTVEQQRSILFVHELKKRKLVDPPALKPA